MFCCYYACFVCFIDLLGVGWCCLYHNDTRNVNATTSLFGLHFVIISI